MEPTHGLHESLFHMSSYVIEWLCFIHVDGGLQQLWFATAPAVGKQHMCAMPWGMVPIAR